MPILFLHGGPGLHARVERAWFGDALPIRWWDQPPSMPGDGAPMRALVAAAAGEVRALATAAGAPVSLVAHSFGGQVARDLADTIPDSIDRIVLLGCAFDPASAYLRFGAALMAAGAGTEELARALAAARARLDGDALLAVIAASFGTPAALRHYFAPRAETVAGRYIAELVAGMVIDFDTLAAILRDRHGHPPAISPSAFAGPVEVVFGDADPVCPPSADLAAWRQVFPQAETRIVASGHMIHVETPPEVWFGPGRAAAVA